MIISDKVNFDIFKFNISVFCATARLLTPVLLFFYIANGLTEKDLLFISGVFYLVSVLIEFPIGYLADYFSKRNILQFSNVLLLIISVLWLCFKGYWIVLIGEILFAFSKVIRDNSSSGYLYDYCSGKDMTKYYGYFNFFMAGGAAFASLFGTWVYAKFGLEKLLLIGCVFFIISIFLLQTLPDIKPKIEENKSFSSSISDFWRIIKNICKDKRVRWHIVYTGFLASFSIVFATGFQVLMKYAMFPVVLFGVITFSNHIIRALSGIVSGKWLCNLNIRCLIVPLFVLYITAFFCVFYILHNPNVVITFILLLAICLIIGVQLAFSILHTSRIHKFVPMENRGALMSVNNFVSRTMAAVMLIASKLWVHNINLNWYYLVLFVLFIVFGTFFMLKVYEVKD